MNSTNTEKTTHVCKLNLPNKNVVLIFTCKILANEGSCIITIIIEVAINPSNTCLIALYRPS